MIAGADNMLIINYRSSVMPCQEAWLSEAPFPTIMLVRRQQTGAALTVDFFYVFHSVKQRRFAGFDT